MGYTTNFNGRFELNKELTPKMAQYLRLFSETRRMGRNVDEVFGIQGEFFVFGSDFKESNVIDQNIEPSTQPSLWCNWTPSEDNHAIEWNGAEKFYYYTEWLVYIINKILAPNGYVLNGIVEWSGEETSDVGEIIVENNKVFEKPWKGSKIEIIPNHNVRTDVVLILDAQLAERFDFVNNRLLN